MISHGLRQVLAAKEGQEIVDETRTDDFGVDRAGVVTLVQVIAASLGSRVPSDWTPRCRPTLLLIATSLGS